MANYAAGVNNLDLAAAAEAKVVVTNTPDVLTATAISRGRWILARESAATRGRSPGAEGRFDGWQPELLLGSGLQGKTLVVGLGESAPQWRGAVWRSACE